MFQSQFQSFELIYDPISDVFSDEIYPQQLFTCIMGGKMLPGGHCRSHQHLSQAGQGIPSHQVYYLHQSSQAPLSSIENVCMISGLWKCLGDIGRPRAAAEVPQSNYHFESKHCTAVQVNQLSCWRPLEGSWPNMSLRSETDSWVAVGQGACQQISEAMTLHLYLCLKPLL